MANIVPYNFQTEMIPLRDPTISDPGFNGVHFTFSAAQREFLHSKLEAWFEDRDEVILVDEGDCEKSDLCYIVMEWDNCEVDPLFLAILRDEDIIEDFSTYFRDEEVYA
jgi:hypothetical protein